MVEGGTVEARAQIFYFLEFPMRLRRYKLFWVIQLDTNKLCLKRRDEKQNLQNYHRKGTLDIPILNCKSDSRSFRFDDKQI